MIERFVKLLRENIHAEVNLKTGWGKEELKLAIERAITLTLSQMVDER